MEEPLDKAAKAPSEDGTNAVARADTAGKAAVRRDDRVDESPMGTEGCLWDENYWAPPELKDEA